ncbi:MAG: CHAT domain-containing protein [Bacteroidota bacterium]
MDQALIKRMFKHVSLIGLACVIFMPLRAQSESEDQQAEWFQGKYIHFHLNTGIKDSAIYYAEGYRDFGLENNRAFDHTLAHMLLYNIYEHYREYELAKQYVFSSLDLAQSYSDEGQLSSADGILATCMNNLAVYSLNRGNFSKAEQIYQESLVLMRQMSDSVERQGALFNTYGNLGSTASQKGDYSAAIEYYEESLRILGPSSIQGNEMDTDLLDKLYYCYLNMAEVYESMTENNQALSYIGKAEHLLDEHPSFNRTRARIRIHEFRAWIQYLMKDFELAEQNLIQAKRYQRQYLGENKSYYFPEGGIGQQALLDREMGNFTQAEQGFKRQLGILLEKKEIENKARIGFVLREMGDLYAAQESWKKAIHTYQKALDSMLLVPRTKGIFSLPSVEQFAFKTEEVISLLQHYAQAQKAYALAENKNSLLLEAHQTYEVMMSLLEEMRDRYQYDASRLFWSEKARPIYGEAIQLALLLAERTHSEEYIEQAFTYADQSKATILYAANQEQRAKNHSVIPDSLLEYERLLKQELTFFQNQLQQATLTPSQDSAQISQLKSLLFQKEKDLQAHLQQLEQTYPVYQRLKYQFPNLSITSIQRELAEENSALIEFFETQEGFIVFVIQADRLDARMIPWGDTQKQHLAELLSQLHHFPSHDSLSTSFEEMSHRVFQDLFAQLPDEMLHRHKGLIIVPDGVLSYLPFEVLVRNQTSEPSMSQDFPPYLLSSHRIRYSHSWQGLSTQQKPSSSFMQVAGFAPEFDGALKLLYAEKEILRIQDQVGGSIFQGNKATETAFLSQTSGTSILHMATHGFYDEDNPALSRLVLQSDSLHDGNVYAYELYNLDIQAELITLSACHTGYGVNHSGEGVLSLARSFQYAGSRSVVLSLWEAQGAVAVDLMPIFYAFLSEGLSKDEALRLAKIQLLTEGHSMFRHPRFWANFTLWGSNDPLQFRNPWMTPLLLLLVISACILVFVFWRKTGKS